MKTEIEQAIAAHGMWKTRLKAGIESGSLEIPTHIIMMDNQCAFGKWLYGVTITEETKHSMHYQTVKKLHAEFHKIAGQVAELATSGKKDEAMRMINLGGEYALASAKLTKEMMQWLQDIDK